MNAEITINKEPTEIVTYYSGKAKVGKREIEFTVIDKFDSGSKKHEPEVQFLDERDDIDHLREMILDKFNEVEEDNE